MAQLTGLQTGTDANDSFLGDFDFDVVTDVVGEGIIDARISMLAGDDRVEGRAVLFPGVGGLSVSGIGIANSSVETGAGDDTVVATGFGARFFEGLGVRGPEYSGTGSSYGLFVSYVEAGSGNDQLTFSGTVEGGGFEEVTGESFGLFQSVVDAGKGADTIRIFGKVGAVDGFIFAGTGDDTVEIVANSDRDAKGINRMTLLGNSGDDTIAISATGDSAETTVAVEASKIIGGGGNDTITLTAVDRAAVSRDFEGTSSAAAGADAGSAIRGYNGEDVISITATADAAGADAYGIRDTRIGSGRDADIITIVAKSTGFGGESFGAFQSTINGGSDDDVITLIGESVTASGIFAAASESAIGGGRGNDTLRFIGRSGVFDSQGSAGLISSSVFGGDGNDLIEVLLEAIEGVGETVADYNIVDSLLGGGDGDDIFDVGIGEGTLSGGSGNDLAIVSYLDTATMSVEAIANGVRISGSQTNNGEAGAWSQNIIETERFLVGETTYTLADFIAEFG